MADDWDGTVKAAVKILGKAGDVPKPKPILKTQIDSAGAGRKTLASAMDDLADALTALEHSVDWPRQYITHFQDKVNVFDYGLDPKNPVSAKKIAEAKKIINAWLDQKIAVINGTDTKLRDGRRRLLELKKQVAQ
jgi:hypothetical protein